MEKYNWIVANKDAALALAHKAQQIYKEKFILDIQLNNIISNHTERRLQIAKDLYATSSTGKVMVTYVLNTVDINQAKLSLDKIFTNLVGQIYPNIELVVAVDNRLSILVKEYCEKHFASVSIFSMDLFDSKCIRKMTDGQAIRIMQKGTYHTYYINIHDEEVWFFDHITTLVRAIENDDSFGSYSGSIIEDRNKYRKVGCFDVLGLHNLFFINKPERLLNAGQFLFKAKAHEFVPDYLFSSLDGYEHYAYANLLCYKYKKELVFTKRSSFFVKCDYDCIEPSIVQKEIQRRFIQDLVQYDISKDIEFDVHKMNINTTSGSVNKQYITDLLLHIPLKSMIKLRYYRIRMRWLSPNSPKYKVIEKKYHSTLADYNRAWGNA